MIHDQKKIEIVKSQLKEEYVKENTVVGQTIVKEDTLVDIIVKLNTNVKIKYKNGIIHNMCHGAFVNGFLPNLPETRALCEFIFLTNPMFSVVYKFLSRRTLIF